MRIKSLSLATAFLFFFMQTGMARAEEIVIMEREGDGDLTARDIAGSSKPGIEEGLRYSDKSSVDGKEMREGQMHEEEMRHGMMDHHMMGGWGFWMGAVMIVIMAGHLVNIVR